MRTRNALERLAAVAPAEPPIDSGEEERILQRILASDRRPAPVHRRRLVLALAGVVVLAVAATVASLELHDSTRTASRGPSKHHHVALTGPRLQLAGYHFKTPAGFKASDASCAATASSGNPVAVMNGFAAAASADGGCVEAFLLIPGSPAAQTPNPPAGQSVDVGPYQGYYDAQGDAGATLYVELPKADPAAAAPVFLALFAQDLTEEQLIAVAQSGLPANP